MADTLFDAYLPLVLWTGLGLIAFRFVPQAFPRFLGRALYWVGVPRVERKKRRILPGALGGGRAPSCV